MSTYRGGVRSHTSNTSHCKLSLCQMFLIKTHLVPYSFSAVIQCHKLDVYVVLSKLTDKLKKLAVAVQIKSIHLKVFSQKHKCTSFYTLYVCQRLSRLFYLALVSCVCVCLCIPLLHVLDPFLHASCAVTAWTPSVLQTRILPSQPTPPLPPYHTCRGWWRGLKVPSPFPVLPRLPWATGLQLSGAHRGREHG